MCQNGRRPSEVAPILLTGWRTRRRRGEAGLGPRVVPTTTGPRHLRRVVSELNRRRFLGALSAAVLGGVGVARGVLGGPPQTPTAVAAAVASPPRAGGKVIPAALLPQPAPIERVPLPGGGVLNKLPGDGNLLALTVDDGVNTDVVRLYTEFARDTGVRLTYFVNGTYRSWTDNLALLRPLVESGQIQLGNHTWSHPNLTKLPASRVAQQISRNDAVLENHLRGGRAAVPSATVRKAQLDR